MNEWKKWPVKIIEKKDFPKQLKEIKNVPEKLYYRGEWNNQIFEKSLAVVGSRRMSRYGKEVINQFMPELVAKNITIISGFMYGVDTESHLACLEFGGKTVAVLGGGLNVLTPVENDNLYTKILKNAGLVSDDKRGNSIFYSLRVPCIMQFMSCVEDVLSANAKQHNAILKCCRR